MTKARRHPYPPPDRGLTGRTAIVGTALGVDRVDIGILAGLPTAIFEDAGGTLWLVDNNGGLLRLRTPTGVKLSLGPGGDLVVTGSVTSGAITATSINALDLTPTITATVKASTAQTITAANDNVETTLVFDTVVENVGLTWDGTNYELVVVTAGLYLAQADNAWGVDTAGIANGVSSSMGYRTLHILKDPRGTTVILADTHVNPGGPDSTSTSGGAATNRVPVTTAASRVIRLAAGDRIGCSGLKVTDPAATVAIDVRAARMTLTRLGA